MEISLVTIPNARIRPPGVTVRRLLEEEENDEEEEQYNSLFEETPISTDPPYDSAEIPYQFSICSEIGLDTASAASCIALEKKSVTHMIEFGEGTTLF